MEDNKIIDDLIAILNAEDIWFTQKTDPTIGEAPDYFKLDEYGDLTEASIKQIIKEIISLIGDGAVDEADAINLWIQDAMVDNKIAYKDILVTKFKDKPVVDGIEAFENPVQLSEGLLKESRPNWSGWDRISVNMAAKQQLLQYALDKEYIVKYYTEVGEDFIHNDKMEITVPANAFKGNVTDNMVEEYIKKQLPKGATIEEIAYKYYEDEKAMNKRIRQYLGKSKKDVDKEEKEAEEISYLQDRILDYERKGRGTKQQYEKDLDRLHKLQGLDENKKVESKNGVVKELKELNVSSFEELREEIDRLLEEEIINEEYEDFLDIISNQEDACEDYIRRRSNVTNTDWKDELGIEADYVTSAIQDMIQSDVLEENKKTESMYELEKDAEIKLGVCPYCGSKHLDIDNEPEVIEYNDYLSYHWYCKDCQKEGQFVFSMEFIGQDLYRDDETTSETDFVGKTENFNKCTKDKKEENVKRRLKEENNKSANLISQMIQDKDFDADSNAGKIVLRTSELFNALSEKGYDVQVAFDNGESTSAVLLGEQGGQVIITITDSQQQLKAFASGNFEINNDNTAIMNNIADIVKSV